ncbi:hypothetical protein [Runella zeae]|uniref:hypothetical protein n=1 Tax=Runella zeae TaxID=94255 RepID=UPI0012F97D51|nr:hypothetical protein [Runella zeae]
MIISTFSYTSWGQLFTDRNLYEVLREVEAKLNQGKFDDAIKLCQIYPKERVFNDLAQNAKILKNLYIKGTELLRNKDYTRSYELFNTYRKYSGNSLRIFDLAIQKSLEGIGKIKDTQITVAERRIYGLGKVIEGRNQLNALDTSRAEISFRSARDRAAKYDQQVAIETQKGLKQVEGLKLWGRRLRELQSKPLSPEERISLLEDYRKATSNEVSVKSLEEKIEYLKTLSQPDTAIAPITPSQKMLYFAQNCKTELLVAYIKDNDAKIPVASQLSSSLTMYHQTELDIIQFKQDPGKREFAKAAYEKLKEITNTIHEKSVGSALNICARKAYCEYLIEIAAKSEKAADQNNNYKSLYEDALRNLTIALNQKVPEYEQTLKQSQRRISERLGCDTFVRDFKRSIVSVRRSLSNCRVKEAQQNWQQALAKLSGCEANGGILKLYMGLKDSILVVLVADSIMSHNEKAAKELLSKLECKEAESIYKRLSSLKTCNQNELKKIISEGLIACEECTRKKCYITNRQAAEKLEANSLWKDAYSNYQQALSCASEADKEEVIVKMKLIECEAFPERCKSETTYFRPEIIGAYSLIKPTYTIGDKTQEMTIWYHISGGLQLSLISHSSPVDFSIGAEYFQTQFQSLGTIKETKYVLEDFSLKGVNGFAVMKLHKGITDPNRWRPYVKLGVEAMVPLSYRYEHYATGKVIDNREQLNSQSFSGIGGIGIELQRKHVGCFLELFGSYNFTGIYNANATNPSITLNSSISANIHRAGVRLGFRFW